MASTLPGYELGRQIGTGARSQIFLVVRKTDRTKFAAKRVVRNGSDDDRFVEQMETEYEVTRSVEHPTLRKSIDIQPVRRMMKLKELWLIMEYVDGLPLVSARPNRLNTFLKLMTMTAEGLRALHDSGYIHTDIKPNNIMIGRGLLLKIIDFGQACPIGRRKERIQGTPDFIAPEQVKRHPLDQRTDVFNLGATMYWLLTSENYPTLMSEDVEMSQNRKVKTAPVAPIERNAKIPSLLSKLVMDCCQENPADRPSDMKEVAGRLTIIQKNWLQHRDDLRDSRMRDAESQAAPAVGEAADQETRVDAPAEGGAFITEFEGDAETGVEDSRPSTSNGELRDGE